MATGFLSPVHVPLLLPVVLGTGARLFGDSPVKFTLAQTHSYDNGALHLAYRTAA